MTKPKYIIKKIANSRIKYLFEQAKKVYNKDPDLANRYVELAQAYSRSANVKIPKELKRRICHSCKKFLVPGVNCRYRMQSRSGKGSHITLTCFNCNNKTRYYIKKENLKKGKTEKNIAEVNN